MATNLQLQDQSKNRVDITLDEDGTFSFKVTFIRKYIDSDLPSIIKAMKWESIATEQPTPLRLVK